MNWHVLEPNWRELVQIRKPKKKKKKTLMQHKHASNRISAS